jgi:drug/metabolite transporter (DMT)-like permease
VSDRTRAAGVVLAACGAISYGVTVVIGEDLADAGFGPSTALGVRFTVSGVLLAIVLAVRRAPIFPSRREVLIGLGLGLAYAFEATFFFLGLERMTAAATALIFYVYPSCVMIIELARGRERPHRGVFVAIGLSTLGTAVVVAAGSEVSVTAVGVLCALGAALSFAVYLLAGREFGVGTDPMTIACWIGFGAGMSNLARGAVTQDLTSPADRMPEIVLYGLATAIAFTLTFAAMRRIGATRVAIVMTLEAVSSIVLAAIFLDESITIVQALGGVAVLAAAVVIARAQPDLAMAEATAPGAGT